MSLIPSPVRPAASRQCRLTSVSPTQRFGGVPIISRSVAGQMRGRLLPSRSHAVALKHDRHRNASDSRNRYGRSTSGKRLSLRVIALASLASGAIDVVAFRAGPRSRRNRSSTPNAIRPSAAPSYQLCLSLPDLRVVENPVADRKQVLEGFSRCSGSSPSRRAAPTPPSSVSSHAHARLPCRPQTRR
jgi:hypothetical protein